MTIRAISPVSVSSNPASVEAASSVGHSDNMSEGEDLSIGCLCFSCGKENLEAAMDADFLYLFRPREGHTITLCERCNGNVTEHRLQRVHFGNTRYLRQFLKPDLHHRPLKFDLGQLCRDHQRGHCQRGPMCRFIHICRKLPLKAPSPYTQFTAPNNNTNAHTHAHTNSAQTNAPTRPPVMTPSVNPAHQATPNALTPFMFYDPLLVALQASLLSAAYTPIPQMFVPTNVPQLPQAPASASSASGVPNTVAEIWANQAAAAKGSSGEENPTQVMLQSLKDFAQTFAGIGSVL